MSKIFLFVIAFFISFSFSAIAQFEGEWEQTNGPLGGSVKTMAVDGDNIYAGIENTEWDHNGIFLSTDLGNSWKHIGLLEYKINSIAIFNHIVFAGTDEGLFISSDNGENWQETELKNYISSIQINGNNICVEIGDNIYLSSNNGESWSCIEVNLDYVFSLICWNILRTIYFNR
jgi:hypothetical protein